jgi:hypothetical protein
VRLVHLRPQQQRGSAARDRGVTGGGGGGLRAGAASRTAARPAAAAGALAAVHGLLVSGRDVAATALVCECASACVPPSQFLFPLLLADPLDSLLRCLPRAGGKGAVCLRGRSQPNGCAQRRWRPLAGSLAARGLNNPGWRPALARRKRPPASRPLIGGADAG